jgi:hypothetical protein
MSLAIVARGLTLAGARRLRSAPAALNSGAG